MTAIDEYVRQVMQVVPPASPEYGRIELDVRSHLEETVAAEGSVSAAVNRMGAPAQVARAYLADIPQRFASVPTRILAFVIDFVLGFAVIILGLAFVGLNAAGMVAALAGEPTSPAQIGLGAAVIIGMLIAVTMLSALYFPLLEWRYGQTLGKHLLGIYVTREDGSRIGLLEAVVRRIPFFLEFFWIDAIVALFTERTQRAFDLVARTVVVESVPHRASVPKPDPDAHQA